MPASDAPTKIVPDEVRDVYRFMGTDTAFPFLSEKLRQGRKTRILAFEPEACPTLTRGRFAYDFADTVGLTPLVKMRTLGLGFVPPSIHAGGLRYHGAAQLIDESIVEATACAQDYVAASAVPA